MNTDFEKLGSRALAAKHWRWMEGMLALGRNKKRRIEQVTDGEPFPYFDGPPDLTDPATLGCLLALVRQAWHTDSWHTRLGVDGWEVRDTYTTEVDGKPTTIVCGMDWKGRGGSVDPNGSYGSEAEALVAALEAAP